MRDVCVPVEVPPFHFIGSKLSNACCESGMRVISRDGNE